MSGGGGLEVILIGYCHARAPNPPSPPGPAPSFIPYIKSATGASCNLFNGILFVIKASTYITDMLIGKGKQVKKVETNLIHNLCITKSSFRLCQNKAVKTINQQI